MKLQFMLAWYNVKDYEQAKKFYSGVLGLKPAFEMPGWAEFGNGSEGAPTIGLAAPRPDAPAGAHPAGATVVLYVDDMDSTRKELSARGVKFEGPVEEIPGIVRLSTFRDPSGNLLQLAQPLVKG